MSYAHMGKYDMAALACESMNWASTLIHLAKQNKHHADTLLDIAGYLLDDGQIEFANMADEFEKSL
ncbi:hypothetical protein [Moraxella catarrhalis]|uniref:hypothetical protein n=1 Tax=Moraxella catarrhalis TaxID=480 RepID=UPI00128DE855|nr:hypothetical protein [Moraxella catarrhalis]MPX82946.1 hypothetical protein [Moraxella catarrhalis]